MKKLYVIGSLLLIAALFSCDGGETSSSSSEKEASIYSETSEVILSNVSENDSSEITISSEEIISSEEYSSEEKIVSSEDIYSSEYISSSEAYFSVVDVESDKISWGPLE